MNKEELLVLDKSEIAAKKDKGEMEDAGEAYANAVFFTEMIDGLVASRADVDMVKGSMKEELELAAARGVSPEDVLGASDRKGRSASTLAATT